MIATIKESPMKKTALILKSAGQTLLVAAVVFILAGITDVGLRKGLTAALEVVSFDFVNLLVLAFLFIPGGLLIGLATFIRNRRHGSKKRHPRLELANGTH